VIFKSSKYCCNIQELLEKAVAEQAATIEEDNAGGFEDAARPVLSRKASDLLDGIFSIVETMSSRNALYRDDYRLSVVSSQVGMHRLPVLVHRIPVSGLAG
jgi:hypothetical protein